MAKGTDEVLVPRHSRVRPRGPWGRIGAFIASVLVVALATGVSAAVYVVNGLVTNTETVDIGEPGEVPPQIGAIEGGTNILIVGIDSRKDTGNQFASRADSILNDVNMLVHISEDQQSIYAITFPRDLVIPQPNCDQLGWTAPINVAWSRGGLKCVVKTIESLTGMKIPYAATITFGGVIEMSNAVGGVEVCVSGKPIEDKYARVGKGKRLKLKVGKHVIQGPTALAYLRVRYGVGDGSDLGRVSTQQTYLSSLVRKVKSDETLTDIGRMYSLAEAATRNMTLSSSLANVDTLIALVRILAKVDMDRVVFLSYPNRYGTGEFKNKVLPVEADAKALFDALKKGQKVVPQKGNTGPGSTVKDQGDRNTKGTVQLPASIKGQLATDVTCSVGNPGGGT